MKILFIHNNYSSNNSGEEHASQGLADILVENGHQVIWYRKSSDLIGESVYLKIKAFFSSFYNRASMKEIKALIQNEKPDLVQIQNVYPFISPAVFHTINKMNIPIIMRCPNYRLFCPTGLHLDGKGQVCEKCLGGLREFNGILKNCEKSWLKSIGYSLRNFIARVWWRIQDRASVYIVQTEFQRQKFIKNGIPEDKLQIVPGLTPKISQVGVIKNEFISFIGRASQEKGIFEFIEAARLLPDEKFIVAGSVDPSVEQAKKNGPSNIEWKGFLSGKQFDELYAHSKMIVVPSKWYEGFPNVITRAMLFNKPVVSTSIGATNTIIENEIDGILVEPGNSIKLYEGIKKLIDDPELSLKIGENARLKAEKLFNNKVIYENLMEAYNKALLVN